MLPIQIFHEKGEWFMIWFKNVFYLRRMSGSLDVMFRRSTLVLMVETYEGGDEYGRGSCVKFGTSFQQDHLVATVSGFRGSVSSEIGSEGRRAVSAHALRRAWGKVMRRWADGAGEDSETVEEIDGEGSGEDDDNEEEDSEGDSIETCTEEDEKVTSGAADEGQGLPPKAQEVSQWENSHLSKSPLHIWAVKGQEVLTKFDPCLDSACPVGVRFEKGLEFGDEKRQVGEIFQSTDYALKVFDNLPQPNPEAVEGFSLVDSDMVGTKIDMDKGGHEKEGTEDGQYEEEVSTSEIKPPGKSKLNASKLSCIQSAVVKDVGFSDFGGTLGGRQTQDSVPDANSGDARKVRLPSGLRPWAWDIPLSMANRFSVLGSIYSDEYDKSYPLLAGTKSETRSNSRVLRAAKRSSSEAILNEADSIRKSQLGVSNLPKYEMSAIRSVTKSIENEVAILRKVEPLDSKRLKALEKRIIYLKRSKSPIRFKPL
ncbi:hypothetical protein U1Q18_017885 [Sarracenia purpurea var. burkii]